MRLALALLTSIHERLPDHNRHALDFSTPMLFVAVLTIERPAEQMPRLALATETEARVTLALLPAPKGPVLAIRANRN
jgi:hypothetical protein